MVVEGTTTIALRRAAGHITNTGMPGVPGNVAIAAHRDTFFRPLRNIRKNDIITLTTVGAEYRYRVVSTKVVDPGDVSVLNPGDDEVLTLGDLLSVFLRRLRTSAFCREGRADHLWADWYR